MPTSTFALAQHGQLDKAGAAVELDHVLKSNHDQISAEVQHFAQQQVGLIGRLFPSNIQRLFRDQQLLRVKTELEFRHRLLDLHVEIQLAALNEKFENWLKVIKVEYRQQFIDFVTQRQQQLRRAIDERRVDYLRDDVERWKVYDEYKHLTSATLYAQSIQDEAAKYFEWLNRLISDFQAIVDEKIRSYKAE